jgi:lipoprotein-releasing system permease protein
MYLGIIVSVAALCATFIIFEGYETTLKKTILGVNSHIYFFNPGAKDLSESDFEVISKFLSDKPEVKAFSGIVTGQAIISKGDRTKGTFFKSVDWQSENKTSMYQEAVNEGTWELHHENDIVIGKYLARTLNANIGDEVNVMSTSSVSTGMTGISYRTKKMRIVGIFYCGMYEYDSRYLFMNSETASHFETTDSRYTLIEVLLHEDSINRASELAVRWERELLHKYQISSWVMFNGNLFSLLALQKWVLTFIISFLIIVASFNVITTTLASINEKRKEIGLLKTIGLSGKKIALLFLTQINLFATICIVLGIFLGIGIGYLISYQTMISLKGEVYLLDKIHIYVDILKMLVIFGIAFCIINLASLIPLRQVTKFSEVEILRYRK